MSVALPTGIQANDQILVAATLPAGQSITTAPAGYTVVAERAVSNGARVVLYRKTAIGAETSATVTFSGSYVKTLMAAVYRGVDPFTPIDATATGTRTSGTSVTVDSITTTLPGTRLVMVEGTTGNLLPRQFTQPPGMVDRVNESGQVQITSALGDQTLPDAGPTGPRTATYSEARPLVGILAALRPDRTTYTYDSRGNRTRSTKSLATTSYDYDQADRLVATGDVTYAYDADGLRVRTATPAGQLAHAWDQTSGLPLMLTETPLDQTGTPDPAAATHYVYGPGARVLNEIAPRPDATLVASDAVASGTQATIAVNVPATVAAGDQILVAATYHQNSSVTTPTGYTTLGTWSGPSSRMRVFRRTATGTEGTVNVTFSAAISPKALALSVHRGIDPTAPVVETVSGSANGNMVTTPTATASDEGDVYVSFAGAAQLVPSVGNWTAPAGMTRHEQAEAGIVSTAISDQTLTAAGGTGTRTWNYNATGSLIATGIVLRRVPTPERWHHHDQLGSVRTLTNENGATIGSATYDPYGSPTAMTGQRSQFGYAGEYMDPTGLIYLRARWYDPATGQFLTRDPLVAVSSDPYGYAGNSPVNNTDPTGLICFGAACVDVPLIDDVGAALDRVWDTAGEVASDTGGALIRNRGAIATVGALGLCFVPAVGWVGCGAASVGALGVRTEQRYADGSETAVRDSAIDGGLTYLTIGLGGAFSLFDDLGRIAYGGRFIPGGYDAIGLAGWYQDRGLLARLQGC